MSVAPTLSKILHSPSLIYILELLGKLRNAMWRFPCDDNSRSALEWISRLAGEADQEKVSFTKDFVSNFLAHKRARPEFVENILAWLVEIDGKVDDFGEVLAAIAWVCRQLNNLTGISVDELMQSIECTGNDDAMDHANLNHVSERLAILDDTGRAKHIWPYIRRKCRLVRDTSRSYRLACHVHALSQRKPVACGRIRSQAKEYVASLKAETGLAPCLPFDRFNDESGPRVLCSAVTLCEKCAVLVALHDNYFVDDVLLLKSTDLESQQLAVWLDVKRHVDGHEYQHLDRVEDWFNDVLGYLRGAAASGLDVLAEATSPAKGNAGGASPRGRNKPTTNMLMIDELQNNAEATSWTITQWQKRVKRARSTIAGTKTWKNLEKDRQKQQAERRTDKRRGGTPMK